MGCEASPQKREINNKMNYQEAKEYVAAYANYQKIPLKDVMTFDSEGKFRGYVFNMEFEYDSTDRILIARGYIFHDRSLLREDIWDKLLLIQKSPYSTDNRNVLEGPELNLLNKTFDLDTTVKEIKPEYYYRLGLRMDFVQSNLSKSDFVKEIKILADESFRWEQSYFLKVVEACNKKYFPFRYEFFIKSYAESEKIYNISIQKTGDDFSTNVKDILFEYNAEKGLHASKEIPVLKNITTELNFYTSKIKSDSLWYWRASVSGNAEKLLLLIKIGDISKSEKEVISIINHCVDSIDAWRKQQ